MALSSFRIIVVVVVVMYHAVIKCENTGGQHVSNGDVVAELKKLNKRGDDLVTTVLSVAARVSTLESKTTDLQSKTSKDEDRIHSLEWFHPGSTVPV